MRFAFSRRLVGRLAGTAAASALVLTGVVATAGPASAAACSGTTGVTVIVDTGSSTTTKCASGDPSSAWKALEAAGHSVTAVQQFPGAICRIDGFPSNQACVRMPPADAYWAFFHAPRGGSWTYSSSGATSYDPSPGTVVGFRFGSGQQPRTAPPAKTATSTPKPTPTKTTAKPKPTTAAPKPTSKPASTTATTSAPSTTKAGAPRTTTSAAPSASASASPSGSVSASASASTSASASASASPSDNPTQLAAGPASDGGSGGTGSTGTLVAGGGLVALVAAGAGFVAWRRRALAV